MSFGRRQTTARGNFGLCWHQGVRAKAWVLLRTVPLWQEVWRQLNGFPPVVADKEPASSKSKDKEEDEDK